MIIPYHLSLLMLCLAFLNCTGKQSQSYSCDITVEKVKISECATCYYVYVLATIGEPNADSVYLPPYVGEYGDRLDCLPSYIKMEIHKKEINFNKTLGFGFIPKQDKRKKLLLLWQQVSKNYLPVDSFKKIFQRQLSLMIWKKTLTSFIRIEFCFTESMVALKETSMKLFHVIGCLLTAVLSTLLISFTSNALQNLGI
ncbi:hypothetical protein [Segatella buccae]